MGLLASEAAAGNYVIAGGDWNHALCGSENYYESNQRMPDWLAVFDESVLPEGLSVVRAENIEDLATCRCAHIPYTPGTTYTATIDGFFVSSNVKATARNVDTGFAYSDHTPCCLRSSLYDDPSGAHIECASQRSFWDGTCTRRADSAPRACAAGTLP